MLAPRSDLFTATRGRPAPRAVRAMRAKLADPAAGQDRRARPLTVKSVRAAARFSRGRESGTRR